MSNKSISKRLISSITFVLVNTIIDGMIATVFVSMALVICLIVSWLVSIYWAIMSAAVYNQSIYGVIAVTLAALLVMWNYRNVKKYSGIAK